MTREVRVLPDRATLAATVAQDFLDLLIARQAAGAVPHIALTGGTVADDIHAAIAAHPRRSEVDWTKVVFWWGDERFVEEGSPDRNAGQARRTFLDRVGAIQVQEIPSSTESSSAEEAAAAYSDLIRDVGGGAEFDLVMLGVGPDGHVASLFPGFDQLDVDDRIAVAVTGSPKPPPERVTLTYPALNRSAQVWFLVSGGEKAGAVARALADSGTVDETPARGITAPATWYLDQPAAAEQRERAQTTG